MKEQANVLLSVNNLTISLSNQFFVNNVSFEVKENDRLMIVGPNGAGKSTLIRAIAQSIPYSGVVSFEGSNLSHMKSKERAKKIGILSQRNEVNYSFTVEEVVSLGRYAYSSDFFLRSKEDERLIDEALYMTGLLKKRKQSVLSLSGGEIQRTFLAQLFAQDPKLLILDEPTNHLDIQYQKQIFTLIDQWISEKKRAFVAVVHDLSLASYFGNKFLLISNGDVISYGKKEYVLSDKNLKQSYQIDVADWMQTLYQQWI